MKNKYQEALNSLFLTARKTEDIWVMQELVDKATPMKPKRNERYCGNCDTVRLLPYDNYCSNCGYKIDWSDEE